MDEACLLTPAKQTLTQFDKNRNRIAYLVVLKSSEERSVNSWIVK